MVEVKYVTVHFNEECPKCGTEHKVEEEFTPEMDITLMRCTNPECDYSYALKAKFEFEALEVGEPIEEVVEHEVNPNGSLLNPVQLTVCDDCSTVEEGEYKACKQCGSANVKLIEEK